MATYAIGDIQGCYDELQALLEKLDFNPGNDSLWFTGDLVNRGPKSLETLRFVKGLGDKAITVLGNHDLHLIATWYTNRDSLNRSHSLRAINNASDGDELIGWLRHQPLLHHDDTLGFTMVHAGLPPQWDLKLAQDCATEVEAVLQGADYTQFLARMYGNEPNIWNDDLQGRERIRFAINAFTRMRYCTAEGRLEFDHKEAPGKQPTSYLPWFEIPRRKSANMQIIFGHWSTLELRLGNGIHAIDTGCLWGGTLTAFCLENGEIVSLDCPGTCPPGLSVEKD